MRNFGTIYRFEMKKIFQKKYVPVLLVLMTAAAVFLNLRPLFGEQAVSYLDENNEFVYETVSNYEAARLERKFAEQYSGKPLDNAAAVLSRDANLKYQEEYSKYDPVMSCILLNNSLINYSIYSMGTNPDLDTTDRIADLAYENMDANQKLEYAGQSLTEDEIRYWENEADRIKEPFTMAYTRGYSHILNKTYWLNMMAIVFIIIALCRSFSDEDVYRTDPLLASARSGRWKVTFAKLAAGESLACGFVLFLFGLTAAIQFFVYGAGGFSAPIQIMYDMAGGTVYSWSSKAITAGEAVLLTAGISLLLTILAGTVVMFLSKLLRRGIPALVPPAALLVLSLTFNIEFYNIDRLKAQIWSYFPFQRLSKEFLLDERLVTLGGLQLNCVQMSVLLYGGIILIALAGCVLVCRARLPERK